MQCDNYEEYQSDEDDGQDDESVNRDDEVDNQDDESENRDDEDDEEHALGLKEMSESGFKVIAALEAVRGELANLTEFDREVLHSIMPEELIE